MPESAAIKSSKTLRSVLISHSHRDAALARAFAKVLGKLFKGVNVQFSSASTPGAGIRTGEDWRQWIRERVEDTDIVVVLLTPHSVSSVWVTWEIGAVQGYTLAKRGGETSAIAERIWPIAYRMQPHQLPEPLQVAQVRWGEDPASAQQFLGDLMRSFNYETMPLEIVEEQAEAKGEELIALTRKALATTPMLKSEGEVLEWCARLDRVITTKRTTEVHHQRRWMELMLLGPSRVQQDDRAPFVDARLHRRLGDLYYGNGDWPEAVEQYELVLGVMPTDITTLLARGRALVKSKDFRKARTVLDEVGKLDPQAWETSPESAGFKGSLLRAQADKAKPGRSREKLLEQAIEAYRAPLDSVYTVMSPYLADNVAQLSLQLGRLDAALEACDSAEEALDSAHFRDVWSYGTRLTVDLIAGHDQATLVGHLRNLRDLEPLPSEYETVVEGMRGIGEGLAKVGRTPPDIDALLRMAADA